MTRGLASGMGACFHTHDSGTLDGMHSLIAFISPYKCCTATSLISGLGTEYVRLGKCTQGTHTCELTETPIPSQAIVAETMEIWTLMIDSETFVQESALL